MLISPNIRKGLGYDITLYRDEFYMLQDSLLIGNKLCSINRKYMLQLQSQDGHLVIYKANGATVNNVTGRTPIWSTGVYSTGVYGGKVYSPSTKLTMQNDSNLVYYKDGTTNPQWASADNMPSPYAIDKTKGGGAYVAVMQNDGNFVIYQAGCGNFTQSCWVNEANQWKVKAATNTVQTAQNNFSFTTDECGLSAPPYKISNFTPKATDSSETNIALKLKYNDRILAIAVNTVGTAGIFCRSALTSTVTRPKNVPVLASTDTTATTTSTVTRPKNVPVFASVPVLASNAIRCFSFTDGVVGAGGSCSYKDFDSKNYTTDAYVSTWNKLTDTTATTPSYCDDEGGEVVKLRTKPFIKLPATVMLKGSQMNVGQFMCSKDKRFKFILQKDGNLVLYQAMKSDGMDVKVLWATNILFTPGDPTAFLFQSDGNIVLYKDGNTVKWSPNIQGKEGEELLITSDGNLQVQTRKPISFFRSHVSVVWSSNSSSNVSGSTATFPECN